MQRRLIIGITGASGVVYGERLLRLLHGLDIETHLVLTKSAALTINYELDRSVDSIKALASKTHPIGDVGASIASGSFKTAGMIIAPCSMHTLAAIATGVCDNLLTRAADVTLKERRRLVLLVRETPLHLGHLRNMTAVTEMGAIVSPPVPAFYSRPKTIEDLVDHTIGRALDLFDIDTRTVTRWRENEPPSRED
jgi:flavin prenyltransferase